MPCKPLASAEGGDGDVDGDDEMYSDVCVCVNCE
jgi:hypothetical protein